MKYNFNKTSYYQDDKLKLKATDFPLHHMGEDFFVINRIEDCDDHYFDGIHRHNFYELLWFTDVKPRQFHYIDFVKYSIADNQLFLLLPDQVHNIEKKDKKGYVCALSVDFFERLIAGDIFKLFYYTLHFSAIVPDSQLPVFYQLLELISWEDEREKRPIILESYLRGLFLHCIELQKEVRATDSSEDARMHHLMELVENNFKLERSAAFYANELSLSSKRLNELTKHIFGKTITQIVNDRVILQAKKEISCCEKSIKEISYELGFSEPSYFTRFFGKQTGHSPEDFRRKTSEIFK